MPSPRLLLVFPLILALLACSCAPAAKTSQGPGGPEVAQGLTDADKAKLREAEDAYEQGHAVRSFELVSELLVKHPDNGALWRLRGNNNLYFGRVDDAMSDYNEAIRLDPKDPENYFFLGLAFVEKEKFAEALDAYNKAVELGSREASTYNNRGNVYRDLKQEDKALADYDEAIRIDPKYSLAYVSRGLLKYTRGHKQSACQDFKKACELGDCNVLELAKTSNLCK